MNFTNKIYDLIVDIKNYLNKKLEFKTRKTTINDTFIFKLLYTMNNATKQNITTKINYFNNNDASCEAYIKRIDSIDIFIFEEFNNYFNKQVDYYFNNDNNEYTIYA
jgi:hypothetical protein